jgi:hypothetical protein
MPLVVLGALEATALHLLPIHSAVAGSLEEALPVAAEAPRPRAVPVAGATVEMTRGTRGDLADLVIETLLHHPRE